MTVNNRQLSTVNSQLRIALVHDYLNQYGGAERVLEAFHEMYPQAPILTSVYDRETMRRLGFSDEGKDIRTSFMQRLKWLNKFPRFYATFLYPLAFWLFDTRGYDVVLSDASYAAKYVRKPKGAVHICYCHTPPRFLYGYDVDSSKQMNAVERSLAGVWRVYLRWLDQRRSRQVDVWVANSHAIQQKIRDVYGKEAIIVHPPVNLQRFEGKAARDDGYYLVVSRLGEYKRVDLIVKAFNQLGWPLKVVGRGPQRDYLRSIAQPNVEILEALSDEEVTNLYLDCHAFVIAAEEDFGITPLEAMACGKPVVALGKGGFTETVVDRVTGVFFLEQTVDSLAEALRRLQDMSFDAGEIKKRASEFDVERFKQRMSEVIQDALKIK